MRLDVTVDDAAIVHMLDGEANLCEEVDNFRLREVALLVRFSFSCQVALLLNQLRKVTAVNEIHHYAQKSTHSIVLFDEADDVGMIKGSQDFCFLFRLLLLFISHLCQLDLLDDG